MSRAVVVGSGPNGLAAALTLADAGLEVTVLEASETIGGGTRSGELTVPGLLHDECSSAHPLAVDNPFTRRFELTAHGLTWLWPEVQYAHPLDGGGGAAALRSLDATADSLGRGGRSWKALFGPLQQRLESVGDELLSGPRRPKHPRALTQFAIPALLPANVLAKRLRSLPARALLGGVAAHGYMPFGAPFSAAIALLLGSAAHTSGWPVAQGGSRAVTEVIAELLHQRGGAIHTGVMVRSLAELGDADVLMFDTAPAAAAAILGQRLPPKVTRALTSYRHGPAAFKLDFAVRGGIPWAYEPAQRAGTVHVGGSLAEIAAGEAMLHRGRMPRSPFVIVSQQYLADPSRSRGDLHPVSAYAHVPAGYDKDVTAAVQLQIERFAPGFRERIVGRQVRTPAQLEAHNPNYVGGDIATGATTGRQLLARPRLTANPHSLGAKGLYLCSAATPPGPGAHGMCGYNAARAALAELGLPIDPESGLSEVTQGQDVRK